MRGMSITASSADAASPRTRPIRLGCVSFVNTLPLIDGLEELPEIDLRFSVPSLLLEQLRRDDVDVALSSSIDYQRSPEPLTILPAGLLGCNGPTLTVRLYSTVPIERITRVYCDTDSHTSIALMRILLREMYELEPELIEYDAREHVANNRPIDWPETVLLIGDKVVTDSPPAVRYPHQFDLGGAWKSHTGLPFVFALWMAKQSFDAERIALAEAILDRQRRHNIERIDRIITQRAVQRNWPADLAGEYLKQRLTFDFTPEHIKAIETFFAKADEHGLIDEQRPLEIVGLGRQPAKNHQQPMATNQ